MTPGEFANELREWVSDFERVSKNVVYNHTPSLLADLKSHSPVDKGVYKEAWRMYKSHVGSALFGYGFTNKDSKAGLIEFGGTPKTAPWYYPSKKKRTGKLVVRDGRVWAGGLNPGHELTVGGAIDNVFTFNRVRSIADDIGQNIIESL